ncbi:MAG: helix-turn-helix domain-containing protein [Cyanobacteriota bacterium]|jgi:AraC family ethanolamine operon transcriptional activator|nr:helix-turn-helix domain-containing protein [Cyanobacteriota bacterium]
MSGSAAQEHLMVPPVLRSFTSVEILQEFLELSGLQFQLLQLEGGPLAGRMLLLDVPPLRLLRLQLNRRLHSQGPKPRGVLTISLDLDPRAGEEPCRSHGFSLPADSLFGLDPSLEAHLILPQKVTCGVLFVRLEALAPWADRFGWPGFHGELCPNTNVVPISTSSAAGLRAYLRRLFALAEEEPGRLLHPATQALIRDDLLPLLLEALISGPSLSRPRRHPARIDTVKLAQQWMHDHLERPITLADLCRQAHASRRTLIQGFQDHLGMGPMAYLKLLRLHGVHRRLLRADPGEIQIGTLAGEWGFYNAGHFAGDYRRVFGERPRDTLHRPR